MPDTSPALPSATSGNGNNQKLGLRLRWLGINTMNEHVVYMRSDSPVSVSEGFEALTRVCVTLGSRTIIASLHPVEGNLLHPDEASLSSMAWQKLGANEGDMVTFSHLPPIGSLRHIRSKMYGIELPGTAYDQIVLELVSDKLSNIELSAFVTACTRNMSLQEVIALTRAMVNTGSRIQWGSTVVADKHSIGGIPGNRTTPIIVAIAAAAGLTIPKTSSRAITSPAGTADTVETFTNVALSIEQIQEVVAEHGGCMAWGGAVKLSPADDILIRVERALDIDSTGQMIASVISKKVAAGATHVVLEVPVGATAKVRSMEEAHELERMMLAVGEAMGVKVQVIITDGSEPVGRGIGPTLEAQDLLAVLRNEPDAPTDLRDKALMLAGALLELTGAAAEGRTRAEELLVSGKAYEKFMAICQAQGGFREPAASPLQQAITAKAAGQVMLIDNRRLAKLAKLAGAPNDATAGIRLHVKQGSRVAKGDTLFTLHAETPGELAYALQYWKAEKDMISVG